MSTIIRDSLSSHGGVAAVDEQVAARHERRGVAGQVDGGAGDLDGQAQPAEQVLGAHHLARLVHVLPAAQHPSGLDRARRDRVGANALRRVVGGEHLRELDQGTLGRAVRRAPRQLAPSVTSRCTGSAWPPPASTSAAVVFAPGSSTSAHATLAPAAAKASAVARPIPFAAPTTMAIFFSSVNPESIITSSMRS